MNLESRIAIEALRAGVPNRAAVRLLKTEETGLENAFDAQLQQVWSDAPGAHPGLGIAGGFGTGKSHFLGYLAEVARIQNFVVSRVVISKETPLSDPARVFEAAARAAVLPDRNDDAIAAAIATLRQSRDKMAALETALERAEGSLAPLFSALMHLLQRDGVPAGFVRHVERFLAGGRLPVSEVKATLAQVGATRKFDLRVPAAAVLMEQRIHFVAALFHAAGYAGWCLLFDEVELIGRYTPLRRAQAYWWLGAWLGLEGARGFPGIVVTYAITDDFVTAVIDERRDEEVLPERLRQKEWHHEARLAVAAMRHIAQTVRGHRLRAPGHEELIRASLRVREIYRAAYDWEPPPPEPPSRTASRTMRQYIKAWITDWDMRRLTGDVTTMVTEEIAANYAEDESLSAVFESGEPTEA